MEEKAKISVKVEEQEPEMKGKLNWRAGLDSGKLDDRVVEVASLNEAKQLGSVLAKSFCGTTKTAPEGAFDWIVGTKYRARGDELYGVLSEDPSKKRLALFMYTFQFVTLFTYKFQNGLPLAIKEGDEILAGALLTRKGKTGRKGCCPNLSTYWSGLVAFLYAVLYGYSILPPCINPFKKENREVLRRCIAMSNVLEKEHERLCPTDHWYVLALGVDPVQQGKKCGKSLLHTINAMCDRDEIEAYLEASGERNTTVYEKSGYVTRKLFEEFYVKDHQEIEPYSHTGGLNLMTRVPFA